MTACPALPAKFRGDPSPGDIVPGASLGLGEACASASPTLSLQTQASALVLDRVAHAMHDAGHAKAVLAPLSETFVPGRFYVVGGPSGAGKTTLLSILALAVAPAHGCIRWGGRDLNQLKPAERARWRRETLGLIFQSSRLVGAMTVSEHIQLAATVRRSPAAVGEGLGLLAALGMGGKLSRLPVQLSGGEKQRVAIAQALCAQPALVLADEPTAALDQANAELVADTLRNYAHRRGAVVVCVSHDRTVIDAADHLLMLERP